MNTYSLYKESGVEWMGEIPSGWKVERIKYVFSKREEKSSTGEEELLSVTIHEGIVPRREYIKEDDHISRSSSLVGYKICYKDDLVNNIMKMGFRCLGISDYDGIVSPGYSVFHFSDKKNIPKYWNYLLRTDLYVTEYKKRSKGIQESRMRLYDDYFVDIYTLIPTIQEQQQISNYLDHKTQQIDSLIEKTQKKIELLKEQRTSLINQVVTKGLNPDVEMKDSGVEWIGEIPSGWDFKRLGFGIDTIVPMRDKPEDLSGEIPWVRIEDKDGRYITKSKTSQGVSRDTVKKMNLKVYPVGTVLCTCSCSFGTTLIVKEPMVSNHTFIGLVPKINILTSEFIFYLLGVYKDELERLSSGSIQQYLSRDNFKSLKVLYPPLQEQQQIVEYLDEQTQKIDSTLEKETQRIDLLKEYRQSLISEVVTGKVDVRDEVLV
jgi:type I restriction enzyme S subunit